MAHSSRLPISKSPDPPQVVPIEYEGETVGPDTPYAFVYRGVRVLCNPVREQGRIVNLAFGCPRCATRQVFGPSAGELTVFPNGLIHVTGTVHCVQCRFSARILGGQAEDLAPWYE